MTALKRGILVLLLLLCHILAKAQINDSSINILQVQLGYALQAPGGDMADRFGINSMIGPSVMLKTKHNILLGLDYKYIFGGMVKEDSILDHLTDSYDGILNQYGEYGTVLLTERGFYAGGKIGYILPFLQTNPNSGIFFTLGGGLLEHHIHIENKDNNVPPVLGDYKKGYDRRTNGFALQEFIGYQYLNATNGVRFYAGFEFYQAWTKNRRSYDFDLMRKDKSQHNDYLYSFRVGWILPLYKKAPDKFYYF